MVTKLKNIPISPELNFLIRAHKGLKGLKTLSDALEDLLVESPTYRELIRKINDFYNPDGGVTKLETGCGSIKLEKRDVKSEIPQDKSVQNHPISDDTLEE